MGFSMGGGSPNMGPRGAMRQFGNVDEEKIFDLTIIARLLRYVLPYRWRLIIAFIAMVAKSLLALVSPYCSQGDD